MSASVQPDEVQLLTALSAGMGAHRTGVQILADGRKKVVVQGIVHVILTIVRARLRASGDAFIFATFWLAYSVFGYFMFTPSVRCAKAPPQHKAIPDLAAILPKLAVYIVLAGALIAVVTARGFAEIDRLQATYSCVALTFIPNATASHRRHSTGCSRRRPTLRWVSQPPWRRR